jgi:hypothetical protein
VAQLPRISTPENLAFKNLASLQIHRCCCRLTPTTAESHLLLQNHTYREVAWNWFI